MKSLKITCSLVLLLTTVKAQYVINYKKVADAYFQNKEYFAASQFYSKALQLSSDSAAMVVPYGFDNKKKKSDKKKEEYEHNIFRLAESKRLYKDYKDAEKWYAIAAAFTDPKYKTASFWYAESLRANQKYKEAITAFERFIKTDADAEMIETAKKEINSCHFALEDLRFPKLAQIKRLPEGINTAGSNYAPSYNNHTLYFTSSRPVTVSNKKRVLQPAEKGVQVVTKENPFVNALYVVSGDINSKPAEVKMINLNGINGMESAAAAFTPNGNRIYFTAWQNKGENKRYVIYSAERKGDAWSNPEVIGSEININGFNAMQPSVTADGKYFLFSSDRPGGYGKYDIWYCHLRPDGSLSQAVNMGPKINTKDDEQAASYNTKTQTLLFSTNGRIGLGGFDFFESKGDLANWSEPQNLGYPFNSSKDDVYFTPVNDTGTEGYISSDRESVCCLELFYIKRESISVKGILRDCRTGKPLPKASVSLDDSLNIQKTITDASGSYSFQVNTRRPLILLLEKENYFTKITEYNFEELAKADTLLSRDMCLTSFKVNEPIALKNIYYDFNSAELMEASKSSLDSLAKIMIENPKIEIEMGSHTDNKGKDEYNLDLSQRRAQSCVSYLISKGISAGRMVAMGYGKNHPIAQNTLPGGKDNPEGRQKNRRTEFKITKQ